jgi:hypothetical protein
MKNLSCIFFLLVVSIIGSGSLSAANNPGAANVNQQQNQYLEQCASTKEYMITLNFLRDQKEYALKERDARKIADAVSREGCTGAAGRFAGVVRLLVRAQLDSKSAIETALKFVPGTDIQARAFSDIFKKFFVREYMNLDLLSSVKLALSLSIDFENFTPKVLNDFNRLAKFCSQGKTLELPKPTCAQLAARVTRLGQNFKESVAIPYVRLYDFLVSKDGANLPAFRAMKTAEEIVAHGPLAEENYKLAYKFAISKKGLALTNVRALEFAMKMAKRTLRVLDKKEIKNQ